jgi:hypothetical protein
MNPIFRGRIEKGKLLLENPARYLMALSNLEGQHIELVVRKQKSQRSLAQNRAYFGIAVDMLCEKTGYDKDSMHDALRTKFASTEDLTTGLRVIESTSKMDTVRFMKYYDDIQRWAAEFLDVYIPSPNESDIYLGDYTHGRI